MILLANRFWSIPSIDVWWPSRAEEVHEATKNAPIVTVMQCTDGIAQDLASRAFQRKPFSTLLIQLDRPLDELWSDLSELSRRQIKRAKEIEHSIAVNTAMEASRDLINDHISRAGFRKAVSTQEWGKLIETADVFSIAHAGDLVAAHVNLVDPGNRARMLMSATVERSRSPIVGPLNRMLHWHELQHYKERGTRVYDFGGLELDQRSPLYSITRFKRSFGGEQVDENIVRVARNRVLRDVLRVASRGRSVVMSSASRGRSAWRKSEQTSARS